MSYHSWIVKNGVLGTAIVDGEAIADFLPASVTPSRSHQAPNLVDVLRSEADFTPLGQLLAEVMGRASLSSLSVEAVPHPCALLPAGNSAPLIIAPRMDFRVVKYPPQEYFPVGRLAVLSASLNRQDFIREFLPTHTANGLQFLPIRLHDLPIELECIVAYELTYEYLGKRFMHDPVPRLIGVHERTVTELEYQLSPTKVDFTVDVVMRNRLCRDQRRLRWHLRVGLEKLMLALETGLQNPKDVQEIHGWLLRDGHDESIPTCLNAHLASMRALFGLRAPNAPHPEYVQLKHGIAEKAQQLMAGKIFDR